MQQYQTIDKDLAQYLLEEGFKYEKKEGVYMFEYTKELGRIVVDYNSSKK